MQITRPRAVLLAVSILLLGTFILTRRGAGASTSAQDDDEFGNPILTLRNSTTSNFASAVA